MASGDPGPRASSVLVLITVVVAAVLVLIGLAALVPAVGDLLAARPVVVIILVVGTLAVLARALRR